MDEFELSIVIAERVETQRGPVTGQVWLLIGSARSQRLLKMCPGDAEIVLRGSGGKSRNSLARIHGCARDLTRSIDRPAVRLPCGW